MKHSRFRAVAGNIITKVKPLNILRRWDCFIRCPQLNDHKRYPPLSVDVPFTSIMEPLSQTAKGTAVHCTNSQRLLRVSLWNDSILPRAYMTWCPSLLSPSSPSSSLAHSLPCSPCNRRNPTSSPSLLSLPLTLFYFQCQIPTTPKEVRILQSHSAAIPHALLIQPPPFHVFTRSHQQLPLVNVVIHCAFANGSLPFTCKCTVITPIL